MSFQTNQVAEIIILALGERSASRGSGYLLFSHCVLTAFHVVKDCGDRPIHVRLLGTYQDDPSTWPSAEVVWKNPQLDLAILKWHSNYDNAVIKPRIKTLNLDRDHRCKAYGFPRYNVTSDGKGVDVDVLKGEIKSIQSPKSPGQLRIENLRSIPKSMDEWKGFSGGPVFSDGDLVGVIVKGPESLQGQRLEAIALDYALGADATLNQCLRDSFKQELLVVDIDGIEASKRYDLEQELAALKLRKNLIDVERSERQTESYRINMSIESLEIKLADYIQKNPSAVGMSELPKRRLEDFLVNLSELSEDYQAIFWSTWSRHVGFSRSMAQLIGGVQGAFTLLIGSQNSECLSQFLFDLYVQLSQSNLRVELDELVQLSTACGVDLNQVRIVASSGPNAIKATQPQSKESEKSSLLVKIEGGSTPLSYQIKVWLVSDCQVYQDRMRGLSDSASQPISEESAATPLVNGQEIQVQSEQTQAEEIKRFLGELFKSIWTKQGLRRLNPHVTFFVPDQLLAIDFHNIQWGVRGDILGRKVPVSVSCLGRFDESEGVNEVINEYREYWIERWQMLEDYGDRPLSEHIEHLECDEDNPDVDITCPQSFQCWLEEKDDEREWQVSGLGLYSPHGDLAKAFISFLLGGVPFIFWPSRVLDPGEVSELEQRMGVVPAEFLREFKSCRLRLGSRTKDAGPMSILLDNPYLCPPDCEFDY